MDSFWFGECYLCGEYYSATNGFCDNCRPNLPFNSTACVVCAAPLTSSLPVCYFCSRDPPFVTRTVALFRYDFPINTFILRLKSKNGAGLIPAVSIMLFLNAAKKMARPDAIVPIPLHRSRLAARGFNQSYEMARVLCRLWGIPLASKICRRVRNTAPQQGLDNKKRQENMRNAFFVSKNHGYRHLLLLDDVITTGSTVNSLAKAVKQTGVIRVDALCLAKVTPGR